jgi:hypothetical protein
MIVITYLGNPKGVPIHHGSLNSNMLYYNDHICKVCNFLQPSATISLGWLPIYHGNLQILIIRLWVVIIISNHSSRRGLILYSILLHLFKIPSFGPCAWSDIKFMQFTVQILESGVCLSVDNQMCSAAFQTGDDTAAIVCEFKPGQEKGLKLEILTDLKRDLEGEFGLQITDILVCPKGSVCLSLYTKQRVY